MVGWHHQLKGREFLHTLGDSEGQGSLACDSLWGHKDGGNLKVHLLKNGYIHTMECYSAFKKKEILSLVST